MAEAGHQSTLAKQLREQVYTYTLSRLCKMSLAAFAHHFSDFDQSKHESQLFKFGLL